MTNPYAPPKSELIETDAAIDGETVLLKLAGRWTRFAATMIDSIIGICAAVPFWLLTGTWDALMSGQAISLGWTLAALTYGMITTVLLHGYFIHRYGQTIGKKILGIRIADLQGGLPGFNRIIFLRFLPISIVASIPVIGTFLAMVDVLFIFRSDRRCIHDLIAGTQVLA